MCAPTSVITHASALASSASLAMGTFVNQLVGFSIVAAVLGFKVVKGLSAFKNFGIQRVTSSIRRFLGIVHGAR